MRRPTVLHCVRDWVRPSETFVADLVGSTAATRAVVACGTRWPETATAVPVRHVPVHALGRWGPDPSRPTGRRVLRGLLLATAVAARADLLHAHFGYWAAHAGRTAARLRRPWVLSLHGHDLLVEDRSNPEAQVLRTADLVLVPSVFLADAASDAGFADERIRVLPSGIDLDGLSYRERTPSSPLVVTFAGRFVPKKGVLDAADALAEVARVRPDLRAVFVGFGPLEGELRRRLAERGLVADIRRGDVAGAVRQALADTDLVVMPSCTAPDGDAESLGLVAIEAQACGVPVVATRHGGLAEAVSPKAGILVDEHDVPGIAAAILALADKPAAWPAMARAGRQHVIDRFVLADRVAETEQCYLSLLRHAALRPAPTEATRSTPDPPGGAQAP